MIAPTTKKEMDALGWDAADVILFTGDAFIDHPSFGTAVVTRALEARGYKVAVVPQPNWRDDLRDFKKMGTPRLYFAVNAGNLLTQGFSRISRTQRNRRALIHTERRRNKAGDFQRRGILR